MKNRIFKAVASAIGAFLAAVLALPALTQSVARGARERLFRRQDFCRVVRCRRSAPHRKNPTHIILMRKLLALFVVCSTWFVAGSAWGHEGPPGNQYPEDHYWNPRAMSHEELYGPDGTKPSHFTRDDCNSYCPDGHIVHRSHQGNECIDTHNHGGIPPGVECTNRCYYTNGGVTCPRDKIPEGEFLYRNPVTREKHTLHDLYHCRGTYQAGGYTFLRRLKGESVAGYGEFDWKCVRTPRIGSREERKEACDTLREYGFVWDDSYRGFTPRFGGKCVYDPGAANTATACDGAATYDYSTDECVCEAPDKEFNGVCVSNSSAGASCQDDVDRLKAELNRLREIHRSNRARTHEAWAAVQAYRDGELASRIEAYRSSPSAETLRLKREAKDHLVFLRDEYRRIAQEKKEFHREQVIPARDAKRESKRNCQESGSCPDGQQEFDGECAVRESCRADQEWDSVTNECECPAGHGELDGQCIEIVMCEEFLGDGAADKPTYALKPQCECVEETHHKNATNDGCVARVSPQPQGPPTDLSACEGPDWEIVEERSSNWTIVTSCVRKCEEGSFRLTGEGVPWYRYNHCTPPEGEGFVPGEGSWVRCSEGLVQDANYECSLPACPETEFDAARDGITCVPCIDGLVINNECVCPAGEELLNGACFVECAEGLERIGDSYACQNSACAEIGVETKSDGTCGCPDGSARCLATGGPCEGRYWDSSDGSCYACDDGEALLLDENGIIVQSENGEGVCAIVPESTPCPVFGHDENCECPDGTGPKQLTSCYKDGAVVYVCDENTDPLSIGCENPDPVVNCRDTFGPGSTDEPAEAAASECGCQEGFRKEHHECVPICANGQQASADNSSCVCPAGKAEFGGYCFTPDLNCFNDPHPFHDVLQCSRYVCAEQGGAYHNSDCHVCTGGKEPRLVEGGNLGFRCSCPAGQQDFNGVCETPATCRSDQLRQSDNTCACPEGQTEFGGDTPSDADDFCAVAAICDSEQYLLPDNTCGCRVDYTFNRLDGSGGIRTTEHNSVRPEFCARDMADICSNIRPGNVGIHIADPEAGCLICESPLLISGGECVESCEEGYVAENGVCVQSCRTDQVRSSDDACVCPEGQREFGGVCAEPAACRPDQSLQSDNTCACPEGQHEVNGVRIGTLPNDKICAIPPECEGGEVSSDNLCVCPEGRILDGGECRLPSDDSECLDVSASEPVYDASDPDNCRPRVEMDCADNEEFMPDEASGGGACVACSEGESKFNGRCATPVACAGGEVSSANVCVCPEGQKAVGGSCECGDAANELVEGECLPACRSDQDRNDAGECACPESQREFGNPGVCEIPKRCGFGFELSDENICECPEGNEIRTLSGGSKICVTPLDCGPNATAIVNGSSDICRCDEGYHDPSDPDIEGCVKSCRPDQERQGDTCVCPEGQEEINGSCVVPVACSGGEVSSANVCVCPEKQKNVGGVCECSDFGDEMVGGQCVSKCRTDQERVEGACQCPAGQREFAEVPGVCAIPNVCEAGFALNEFNNVCECSNGNDPRTLSDGSKACECPEGTRVFETRSPDLNIIKLCVPAVSCSGGEVSSANVCVCPEKQKNVGGVCECSDSADRMVDGQCVPAVACSGGEVSSANVCICPEKQKNVEGVCECSDSADRMVNGQCVPAASEGGSSLTRDASKVESEHQDLLEGATANLGFSPAGLAGGTAVGSEDSEPSRLPEYAAPAALIGALAFSQLYPDYSIVPSFDFSGENESVIWKSGMTGEFERGAFRSFISASHSSAGGFSLASGTAYRGDWFSGSYRALESRNEMDYELNVSSPVSLGLWELSPQAGAEFGYRRADDEWHSDSSVGVLASWTAHRWKVSAQSNFAGYGRHALDLELRF